MRADSSNGLTEEQKKVLDNCDCGPVQLFASPEAAHAFDSASDHDYYCRCEQCKSWWRQVGPEENGTFGPFTSEEIRNNV